MLPSASGYQQINLTPIPLKRSKKVTFTFSGGPFDGHQSTATVKCRMDTRFTVVMKNKQGKYLYRYAGKNAWKYEKSV